MSTCKCGHTKLMHVMPVPMPVGGCGVIGCQCRQFSSTVRAGEDTHVGCGGRIVGVDPDGYGNLYHCSKCGSDNV